MTVALFGVLGASAPVAGAMGLKVKRMWMPAPAAPETPTSFNFKGGHIGKNVNLNQVGVIKIGSAKAKNVMVFVPGTSGGAAYIVPFAKSIVERLPDWQVWSVERRENLLEDQSMIAKAKKGKATPAQTVPLLPRLPHRRRAASRT